MSRIGYRPLWGDLRGAGWLTRLLLYPLVLYQWLFYDTRPNVTDHKVEPHMWRKLHSPWRFFQSAFCFLGPPNHYLWNIKAPLTFLMATSMGIWTWDKYGNPARLDSQNIMRLAFQLTSFVVSLLLSTRISRALDRWKEARTCFAALGNAMVQLAQAAATQGASPWMQGEFVRWGAAWHYALKQRVLGLPGLDAAAAALLEPDESEALAASPNPLLLCNGQMLGLAEQEGINPGGFIGKGSDAVAGCVAISEQALPQGLNYLCTGFLQVWLTLLPFGMWDHDTGSPIFPLIASFFMATLMLSADEVATQLENPWRLLPLRELVEGTHRDSERVCQDAELLKGLRQRRGQEAGEGVKPHSAVDCLP